MTTEQDYVEMAEDCKKRIEEKNKELKKIKERLDEIDLQLKYNYYTTIKVTALIDFRNELESTHGTLPSLMMRPFREHINHYLNDIKQNIIDTRNMTDTDPQSAVNSEDLLDVHTIHEMLNDSGGLSPVSFPLPPRNQWV